MLSYLVTSTARRRLLRVLWVDGAVGSVSSLARLTGLSFAATHRELEAMRVAGLAVSTREGTRVTYRPGGDPKRAALLRALLEAPAREHDEEHDAEIRSWLRSLGAPLTAPPSTATPATGHVVAEALTLAHHDATVARVLPLVLFIHRAEVRRIVAAAKLRNEDQTLGLFLQLAGELSGDRALVAAAKELHDRRRTRLRPFFVSRQGPHALAAERRNTPGVARQWGFLMNMGLDSFASTFRRHVAA